MMPIGGEEGAAATRPSARIQRRMPLVLQTNTGAVPERGGANATTTPGEVAAIAPLL
jgi:hypothetical protein